MHIVFLKYAQINTQYDAKQIYSIYSISFKLLWFAKIAKQYEKEKLYGYIKIRALIIIIFNKA